jgi:hypothetical protein
VRFPARVAVDDGTAGYEVRMFPPGKTGRGASGTTRRFIRSGEVVEQLFQHLNGGGEYRIVVSYLRVAEPGRTPPLRRVTVGRFRLRIP